MDLNVVIFVAGGVAACQLFFNAALGRSAVPVAWVVLVVLLALTGFFLWELDLRLPVRVLAAALPSARPGAAVSDEGAVGRD